MAKYQVETEKGSFTLNGSTAAALASALLVKLNNQRANGYKINGNYGDYMFSVILVDKDRKPFKEYYLKKVGKTQDKSPLSFMDSVVRAFKDKPFDNYNWLIAYQTDLVGKKNFYSKKETKEQAINELKNELIQQGAEKGLKIFSIKKNASEILRRQAGKLGSALQKPKTKKWELYVYNKQNNRHIGIYTIEADTPKAAIEILKKGKRKIMNIEPKDWLIKVNK